MKEQSAVEWLAIQLYENMNMSGDGKVFNEILDEANKMFQRQIKDAIILNQNGLLRRKTVLEAIKYYEETFGGQGSPDTTTSPNTKNK